MSHMPADNFGFDYWEHITINPGVSFGKPCITGTRLAVRDVLAMMAGGMTEEDILAEWDYLTPIQIRSCLAYAADGNLVTPLQPAEPTDARTGTHHPEPSGPTPPNAAPPGLTPTRTPP